MIEFAGNFSVTIINIVYLREDREKVDFELSQNLNKIETPASRIPDRFGVFVIVGSIINCNIKLITIAITRLVRRSAN